MMQRITLFSLLTILAFGVAAAPELKGNPEDLRQFLHPSDKIVSIYAEAEEKAYSDKAVVSLIITTEAKLLSESLSKNSQLRKNITKQLVAASIAAVDIKSSKFSTSPQYGWFGKKPSSYKVVNRMAVSITDETQLKEIAAVSDAMDEVELSDTTFEHTKKDEFEDLVKEQALAKVMRQKAFYEKSLGIRLVPIGFRKADIGHHATRGARLLEEIVVTASKQRSSSYKEVPMSLSSHRSAGAGSSFDEVQYEAGIYVDFKIERDK